MVDIVFTISKYLIIICFGVFTLTSFFAQRDVPDETKSTTYAIQRVLIIAIHGMAYFVICLNVLTGSSDLGIWSVIGFYAGQLAYILFMTIFIPRIARLNQGLNNVMCMLLTIGFIIQTRLSFDNSVKQFLIILAGTVVFLFCCFFCRRASFLKNLTWIYCIAGMGLLLLVLVLSTVSRGAKLSLDIGPFSFQPLEFVKILFVFFVAAAFSKSSTLKNVLITAACAAVHVLIQVFCKDLGSAFILFVIYLMMLYVATRKFIYIILGTGGFAVAAVAAYKLFSHVQVRVSAWLDPWTDINGDGYQIAQSLFAIGTGGWFGSGLFKGSPTTIPLVSKDMVISAISEEFGMIFAIFLILLCLCFVLMIFRVAIRLEQTFYKLVSFGLGVSYAIQVFLTIGGAFKFIPLTGVTLPFISSGGSSIIASMIMLGIVQAMYVISEADVAHERRMVAAGADISEFAGYEDLAEDSDGSEENEYEYYHRHDEQNSRRRKVRRTDPDESYEESYHENLSYDYDNTEQDDRYYDDGYEDTDDIDGEYDYPDEQDYDETDAGDENMNHYSDREIHDRNTDDDRFYRRSPGKLRSTKHAVTYIDPDEIDED